MLTRYLIGSGIVFLLLSCAVGISGLPRSLALWLLLAACFFELLAIALKP